MLSLQPIFILVYGAMTLAFAMFLAYAQGSKLGMLLAVLATGATYVFQTVQYLMIEEPSMVPGGPARLLLVILFVLPMALALASIITSAIGA